MLVISLLIITTIIAVSYTHLHQPAIVEAVNRMEVQSLSRGNFTILDAVEAIRSDYSVCLLYTSRCV